MGYPEANKKKNFDKGKGEKKESEEEEDKEEKPKKKSNKKLFDKSSSPRIRSQMKTRAQVRKTWQVLPSLMALHTTITSDVSNGQMYDNK